MVKKAPLPPARRAELIADFGKNNTRHMRLGLLAYADWLRHDDDRARRFCETGVPAWFLHAEKGDGDLTDHERATLEACSQIAVVTLPGEVFFLPNEAPETIADLITQALAAA
jgi:pimeloyl-ACP methyl ester carboxylesterase